MEPEREAEFAIHLRLPGWCREPRLKLNGKPIEAIEKVRGYARLNRTWHRGDVIDLTLPMPSRRIKAHPKVEADIGRVALGRGPIVYCLEAVDNGGRVRNLVISPAAQLTTEYRPDVLGGVTVVKGPALRTATNRMARDALPVVGQRSGRQRNRVHRNPLLCKFQPRAWRHVGLDGRYREQGRIGVTPQHGQPRDTIGLALLAK